MEPGGAARQDGGRQARYWVVGGVYRDKAFSELDGEPVVHGPYARLDEAASRWRALSFLSTASARTRYQIACELG